METRDEAKLPPQQKGNKKGQKPGGKPNLEEPKSYKNNEDVEKVQVRKPQQRQENKPPTKQQNNPSSQQNPNHRQADSKNATPTSIRQTSSENKGQKDGGSNRAQHVPTPSRLALFDHLPKPRTLTKETTIEADPSHHPAIIRLGNLFRTGIIHDDDDRACSLLVAFCNVVADYKTPQHTNLSRDLDKHIKTQVATN